MKKKKKKKNQNFYLKFFHYVVGKFSIYLNRRVFVMNLLVWSEMIQNIPVFLTSLLCKTGRCIYIKVTYVFKLQVFTAYICVSS